MWGNGQFPDLQYKLKYFCFDTYLYTCICCYTVCMLMCSLLLFVTCDSIILMIFIFAQYEGFEDPLFIQQFDVIMRTKIIILCRIEKNPTRRNIKFNSNQWLFSHYQGLYQTWSNNFVSHNFCSFTVVKMHLAP